MKVCSVFSFCFVIGLVCVVRLCRKVSILFGELVILVVSDFFVVLVKLSSCVVLWCSVMICLMCVELLYLFVCGFWFEVWVW